VELILQILQSAWKVTNLNYGQISLMLGEWHVIWAVFIVLKLANVNNWELGLSPLLPSLQMAYNPNTPQWIKLVLSSHLISLIIAFGSNFQNDR